MRGFAHYEQNNLTGTSASETEIIAFRLVNRLLAGASDADARVRALYRNQQLWSVLLKDLALGGNQLSSELKRQLTQLGIWAQRYSTQAMANNLPLQPLIDVNANMIDGLSAPPAATAAPYHPAALSTALAV